MSHDVVHDNQPPGTIDDATFGGGVVVRALDGATAEVRDCHVFDNVAGRGAGIVAQGGASVAAGAVRVTRNRVERNTARGSHGGGMYVIGASEISYNVVIDNQLLGELGGGGWGAGFIVDGNSARPRPKRAQNSPKRRRRRCDPDPAILPGSAS